MPTVRYLVAVALVLQFSGAPAAWAAPCASLSARGAHSCCLAQKGAAVAHFAASCGCQMKPAPAAPTPSSVAATPEVSNDHGATAAGASASPVPATSLGEAADTGPPPGGRRDSTLSHLAGSGFRC
jgi:hypothetical protein